MLGCAIYSGFLFKTVRTLSAQGRQLGAFPSVLAAQLWPSTVCVPLNLIITLGSLPMLAFNQKFNLAYGWIVDYALYLMPLATRCVSCVRYICVHCICLHLYTPA